MRDKLLLIDAYSIICRGFYALPLLSNEKGLHTNAVLGFLNILYKNIEEVKPKYIAVAFDENNKTFRHKLYKDYKGNRNKMPDELKEQVPYVKKILKASNINIYSKEGFEADDILGTLANKFANKNLEAIILSGDKDMLQLPTENIKVRLVKTVKADSNTYEYYANDVLNEYGVTPDEFIDLKALQGDASDNIPGVKGIGPKTAAELIIKYKSISGIYEHIDEITKKAVKNNLIEQKDIAEFCKTLVTIKKDVPLEVELNELELKNIFNEESFNVVKELELKSQYRKFGKNNDNKKIDKINKVETIDNPFDDTTTNIINTECDIDKKIISDTYNQKVVFGNDEDFNIIKNENEFISIYVYYKNFTKNKSLIHTDDIYLASITTKNKTYVFNYDISDKIIQIAKDKKIIMNNIKSLLCYFDKNDIYDNYFDLKNKQNFEDISIMSYLIDSTKDNYEYDSLYRDFLHIQVKNKKDLFGKTDISDNVDFDNKPNEQLVEYMSLNSKINYILYEYLLKRMDALELKNLYYNIELPLLNILYNMEKIGILVNKNELKSYDEMLDKKIIELTDKIYKVAGEEFNINSPKQLSVILFEKLSLDYDRKKNEKLSTSIEVLQKLYNKHEIVPLIVEYRTISKLSSTYAKGLSAYISDDNRIHTNFNQTETATGRLSSDNPNLQNIPIRTELGKELRKVFIPRDGYTFIDADYSQIELRLLAIISNDEKLISAYKSGTDVHTITASKVFNIDIDKVTPDLRRKAKAVNFGIVYGISAFGLGEDLNIDSKEAKEYINKYFETYNQVKKYLDEVVLEAQKTGYTKTLFGRIRPINEFKGNPFQKAFAKRVAMNAPLQGTASDIIKKAMVLINDEILKHKLSSRMLLQVHDEILIETKIGEEKIIKEILTKCMKDSFDYSVPLEINIEEGKNFEEVH